MQRTINGEEYVLVPEIGRGSCEGCFFATIRESSGMVKCTGLFESRECLDLKKIYKKVGEL